MTYSQVTKLQKIYGVTETQEMINSGQIWHFEGSTGRHAMSLLKCGVCMLPLTPTRDYYGNMIPSRKQVKPESAGSFQNCERFWARVDDGDPDAVDVLNYFTVPVMGSFDENGDCI